MTLINNLSYNIRTVKKTILGLLSFLSLIFVSTSFAGGGLVSFDVSPSLVAPGEQYIVRPSVYSDQYGGTPCRQCTINIKFENPQSGDTINQSTSKTDDNGTMYAKVISQQSGERIIYAEVSMPDGSLYQSSRYVLYYDSKAMPDGNISVKINSQKSLSGNVRQVSLSWNSISDVYYLVFARPINESYGSALVETKDLSAEIKINTTPNYYIKVSACNGLGRCIESNEVLVSELKQEAVPVTIKKPTPPASYITPSPTSKQISPLKKTDSTLSADDKKIEELNQKVESLQNNLEESQSRQSVLEEKLNQILSWIKSIFPLF